MKDDILKFRKTCDVLIADKGYNKNKISIESKLTWPTLKKVLEDPVDEIKIMPSILGIIQDFNKKHIDDVRYAGIQSDIPPAAPVKEKKIASPAARDRNDEAKEVKEVETGKPDPKHTDDFIRLIKRLTAECPSNLKIKITING